MTDKQWDVLRGWGEWNQTIKYSSNRYAIFSYDSDYDVVRIDYFRTLNDEYIRPIVFKKSDEISDKGVLATLKMCWGEMIKERKKQLEQKVRGNL